MPTFSIVTPSLNQGKFVERTIASVLSQEGDFYIDYIVVDGGSIDESVAIFKKYESILAEGKWPVRCAGITFKWYSEADRGQSHAINKGFNLSDGDIYAWLNSDDYYEPGALKIIVDQHLSYPDARVFVGNGLMCDETGNALHIAEAFDVTSESLTNWIHRYFYQPSCFFKKDVWKQCGPLQEWLGYAMDLDLWFKIAKSYKFFPVHELLSTSLKHPSAKTTADGYLAVMEVALVIASHGGAKVAINDYGKLLAQKEKCYQIQIRDMMNSRSWRITYPFRLILEKIRALNI